MVSQAGYNFTMNKIRCLFFCLLINSLACAQDIPHLGSAADALWNKTTEFGIGKAAYENLLRQGRIHQSPPDTDYLNYLGNKIGAYANTRLGLTFYLTNATTINAFATPGGYVGVNAGLVLATENEHELAGVLAHEIAHVSQAHIARSLLAAKDRRAANMAAMAAGILLATAGDSAELGRGVISAAIAGETQQQINDIRRHEIEADRQGRRLMQKAGFNELGMQQFFGKLAASSTTESAPAYLRTHPVPIDRQAAIDSFKNSGERLLSSDEYYLFKARLQTEFLSQKEVEQIITQAESSNTGQERDAGRYLSALVAMNYGKFQAALQSLQQMTTSMKSNRDVGLLSAQLYLLGEQPQKAEQLYERLWKKYPGDSMVVYDYAQFLIAKGYYKKAAQMLKKQADGDADLQLYWLYGQVLGILGEVSEQHRILIRYYRRQGDYARALAQAQIAVSRTDIDWQTRAMFEAQISDLEKILKNADK